MVGYEHLRSEIVGGLVRHEERGDPIDVAMVDVLRVALVLSVAAIGPEETATRLHGFLDHMAQHFQSVRALDVSRFPQTMGRA